MLQLRFLIAMVADVIIDRMARKLAYAQEEGRALRGALAGSTGTVRIGLTDEQRRRLALKGMKVELVAANDNGGGGRIKRLSPLGGVLNDYRRVAA